MAVVQPRCGDSRYKELGAIGVRPLNQHNTKLKYIRHTRAKTPLFSPQSNAASCGSEAMAFTTCPCCASTRVLQRVAICYACDCTLLRLCETDIRSRGHANAHSAGASQLQSAIFVKPHETEGTAPTSICHRENSWTDVFQLEVLVVERWHGGCVCAG